MPVSAIINTGLLLAGRSLGHETDELERFTVIDDLAPLLEDWEHSPGEFSARRIEGLDGRPKLQMRLELGLVQMEWDGRPDGTQPHGQESLLDHFTQQARHHELSRPPAEPFELDADACSELQHEGIQYYYRYLCMLHLGEYAEAERDTARNLRMFDFVKKYAADRDVVWLFEQYRPYVVMMNTRAKVSICLEAQNPKAALTHLRDGILQIRQFLAEYDHMSEDECPELQHLREWRKEIKGLQGIQPSRELTEENRLEAELGEAVATENYEQAAKIRDALKRLRGE